MPNDFCCYHEPVSCTGLAPGGRKRHNTSFHNPFFLSWHLFISSHFVATPLSIFAQCEDLPATRLRWLSFCFVNFLTAFFSLKIECNDITIMPGLERYSPSTNRFFRICLHSPLSSLHTWGSRIHDTLPLGDQDEMSLWIDVDFCLVIRRTFEEATVTNVEWLSYVPLWELHPMQGQCGITRVVCEANIIFFLYRSLCCYLES